MGQGRVELPTSRLSGVRSNHLSYWPDPYGSLQSSLRIRPERLLAPWKLNCTFVWALDFCSLAIAKLLRKEVIQPQVPLRLPCYDFTPVTVHSLGPCLLAVGVGTSGANDSHGVKGGVYKARERIHRCLLISDY